MRIGLLAGESSGDNLGAGLMQSLMLQSPQVEFIGVGGERMMAQGLKSLAAMQVLSVNGFFEPIMRLPQLIKLIRQLIREFTQADIDVFVGIDFNVFNFLLEAALRKRGIKTVHYVSPSVYAWRAGRTKRVAKCADVILCLFPFEPKFYAGLAVRAEFVGHPLADTIETDAGNAAGRRLARQALGLPTDANVLAILPGSRRGEIDLMMADFLGAAEIFCASHDNTIVVIPCIRVELKRDIEQYVKAVPGLIVRIHDGDARQPLQACDVALIKSGTSTLEATLLHRPMVVSYRLGKWTYLLVKRLLRTRYVALPNILANQQLVPELLQDDATATRLGAALIEQFAAAQSDTDFTKPFVQLHQQLRQGANTKAAAAVLGLMQNTHDR
ncbi:MAG: lipid-A-disaccharide synthase [Gammaproteobacteria bacterium]|nr:lipid-A-disaccharide synthase [Gammaproteobacteria bacterium]